MSKVFFMSDPHYGQKNIIKDLSEWEGDGRRERLRDFKSIFHMNDAIVNGINSKVGQDDVLYCLGDWCFGGIENIWNFRKRIICKNVHLIYGNHDEHIEENKLLPNCWKNNLHGDVTIMDGPWQPIMGTGAQAYAQDVFSSVQYVKMFRQGKKSDAIRIFMSHYAHRVWHKSHKGYWHVYGHSHHSLEHEIWGKSMDVGIDSYFELFGRYAPFSLDEIARILSKRPIKFIDHHQEENNE